MAFPPFARPGITGAGIEAVVEAMRSGWLTTGPNAAAFEKEFVGFLDADAHGVTINSATTSLHLTFGVIGVRPGTEVLVSTWTFTSTAEVVRYLGGGPVLVGVDPGTLCIDLEDAEREVTGHTIAIAPVHFSGLIVPDGTLTGFAECHGLKVVEDTAHSFPTLSEEELVDTHGHKATVYSFYVTKTMTTGEGDMVITPDADLAARIRTMRLHGTSRDIFDRYSSIKPSRHYDVVAPDYKYNLTDTAVAMGRVQLTRASEMADRHAAIASRFDAPFADLPVTLPAYAPEDSNHAWHLYVIQLNPDAPVPRDRFIGLVTEHEVGTSVYFIPLHLRPYRRDIYRHTPEDFPVATAESAQAVSPPILFAMAGDDVTQVVDAVRSILE